MITPKVLRGEVIGIGKLKVFPSNDLPYEIPMLSFVVTKREDRSFIASCIQLCMDGYGDSSETAMENMRECCLDFLRENFRNPRNRETAWTNLHELFSSGKSAVELWNAYRTVQLNLAEQGICTDITASII